MARKRTLPNTYHAYGGYSSYTTSRGDIRKSARRDHGGYKKVCYDHLSPGPPYLKENNLTITEWKANSWSRVNLTGWLTLHDYIVPKWDVQDLGMKTLPTSHGLWKTQALASINPNNPVVDVPLFLFELREFPGMLKHLGDILSGLRKGSVAQSPIAYLFGWAPLFSDLQKLLNLADEIEKSRSQIEELRKSDSLKGKLGRENATVTGRKAYINFPGSRRLEYKSRDTQTQEIWYSARITPDFSAPIFGESKAGEISRLLGLNLSAATLWNAIPWSWLIDYFVGVSAYMEATRGQLPFSVDTICTMSKSKTSREYVALRGRKMEGFSMTPGDLTLTRKDRRVHLNPRAGIYMKPNPLSGKLTVLSALAVAKVFG